MSRPRYFWFGFVQKNLSRYPEQLKRMNTIQSCIAISAIEKSLCELQKKPDGDRRLKLFEMLYFKNSHTLNGAAMKLYISPRTAQKWNSEFVYSVARNMGFLN